QVKAQDDGVGELPGGRFQCGGTRGGGGDAVVVNAEVAPQVEQQFRFVLDDENAVHRMAPGEEGGGGAGRGRKSPTVSCTSAPGCLCSVGLWPAGRSTGIPLPCHVS